MNAVKVNSIRPIGVANVVDLTVEKNHTFTTANGVVVHNCNSTQPALRNFIEEYSKNAGFILTCNFKNRIIDPLHSRCSVIDFKISKKDMAKLAGQFFKRVQNILQIEKIEYEPAVIAELINKHFPDWRRVLNEIQRYSANGKIDSGILVNIQESSFKELIQHMKSKNFTEVRKWIKNNIDTDINVLYNQFYDSSFEYFKKSSVAQLVLIIAQYQYQNAFSANPEINFAAFCVECMKELEFE